jgi:TPR repeat protein
MLMDKDGANNAQAAQIMLREAEAGALEAQAYMVFLYDTGIGVPRDKAAAARWEARLGAAFGDDWDKAYAALQVDPGDVEDAVKAGTKTEWALATFRRAWALHRVVKHLERQILEGDAELRRLTRQHNETQRQLAARMGIDLERLGAATTPPPAAKAAPGAATTLPPAPATPPRAAVTTPPPEVAASTMLSLLPRALAGDTGAALAYARGWHEGAGVPRNDMACYFWTGMDPNGATSMALADACDDALSAEQKQGLRAGASRLMRGGALRTPPRDPESAVADFTAWMSVAERLAFSGTPRDQLRARHYYGWALPAMYRYGLATENTALMAALCGPQSCSAADAAMAIVVRAWEAMRLPPAQGR